MIRACSWRICAVPSALTNADAFTGGVATLDPRLRTLCPFGAFRCDGIMVVEVALVRVTVVDLTRVTAVGLTRVTVTMV